MRFYCFFFVFVLLYRKHSLGNKTKDKMSEFPTRCNSRKSYFASPFVIFLNERDTSKDADRFEYTGIELDVATYEEEEIALIIEEDRGEAASQYRIFMILYQEEDSCWWLRNVDTGRILRYAHQGSEIEQEWPSMHEFEDDFIAYVQEVMSN